MRETHSLTFVVQQKYPPDKAFHRAGDKPGGNLNPIIALIVAVVSLLISLLVAVRNWKFTETNIRFTLRNQYMNTVFDIHRQLISKPELWAIYDDHEMAKNRSNSPEEAAKREAFIEYHFNLFETVFHDYHNIVKQTASDKQYWQSWDSWIRHFFNTSSEARKLFRNKSSQETFFADFVSYTNAIIKESKVELLSVVMEPEASSSNLSLNGITRESA